MHAIILASDRFEKISVPIIKVRELSFIETIFDFRNWLISKIMGESMEEAFRLRLVEYDEERSCACIKNSTISNVKILLAYLRKDLGLRKEEISFLRASRFRSADEVMSELRKIISSHSGEDILFYYSGHGSYLYWGLAKTEDGEYLDVKFSELCEYFRTLKKNLIVISDSCHALALSRHLDFMKDRYLMMGMTRVESVGYAGRTVLYSILRRWRMRRTANPKTGWLKINKWGKTLDIPRGRNVSTRVINSCTLHGDEQGFTEAPMKRLKNGISLRVGSPIDHVCFPPR